MGGRQLANLRFANDIDGLTDGETELRQLVNTLERTSNDYVCLCGLVVSVVDLRPSGHGFKAC